MQNRDENGGHHGSDAVQSVMTEPTESRGPGQPAVSANYRYWREHGHEWADEYDRRKTCTPYYHLQELMLTDYFARCAPAKVLEFGCGVGRHLRNLVQIPGLDVHGYDQSSAMVSGCLRWTTQDWLDGHVSIGLPTGPLPFADGEFDVVYTAEVLLHSRPEDIETILRELVRVCRGHILHLETSPDYQLIRDEHDGCWTHDLVAAYARLGHRLERLEAGYVAHTPFRLALGTQGPQPAWPAAVLAVMRRAESDLCAGINEFRQAAQEAVENASAAQSQIAQTGERIRSRILALEADRDRLFAEAKEKQTWIAAVEADRDRLFAEARQKQEWIAAVEADRDRLFSEARQKQEWIGTIEAELVEVKMRLSSLMALAEARGAAASTREAMLNTQIGVLTAKLRDQTDRLVAAEGVLRGFADMIRERLQGG